MCSSSGWQRGGAGPGEQSPSPTRSPIRSPHSGPEIVNGEKLPLGPVPCESLIPDGPVGTAYQGELATSDLPRMVGQDGTVEDEELGTGGRAPQSTRGGGGGPRRSDEAHLRTWAAKLRSRAAGVGQSRWSWGSSGPWPRRAGLSGDGGRDGWGGAVEDELGTGGGWGGRGRDQESENERRVVRVTNCWA
jgi:hypothetical protein